MAAKKTTPKETEKSKNHKHTASEKILFRSEANRVIAGVSGGVGEFFSIDANLIRIVFVLATIFGGGGILVYLVLWFIVPTKSKSHSSVEDNIKTASEEIKDKFDETTSRFSKTNDNTKSFLGLSIIALGSIMLIQNFGFARFFDFGRLWPLFLIIIGVLIIRGSKNR